MFESMRDDAARDLFRRTSDEDLRRIATESKTHVTRYTRATFAKSGLHLYNECTLVINQRVKTVQTIRSVMYLYSRIKMSTVLSRYLSYQID
jgi:hypothetical protein